MGVLVLVSIKIYIKHGWAPIFKVWSRIYTLSLSLKPGGRQNLQKSTCNVHVIFINLHEQAVSKATSQSMTQIVCQQLFLYKNIYIFLDYSTKRLRNLKKQG